MCVKDCQDEIPAEPNQFQQLILACDNNPKQLQEAYDKHRSHRNAQFKERLLDSGFRDWQFDDILHKILEAKQGLSEYVDARNNLALWARPPKHIIGLIHEIQQEIAPLAGEGLWLAPMKNLHMTTLEIMSARREAEVDEVATFLQTKAPLRGIVDYTLAHRARLIRPIVSFDASAIALGFLPAEEGYSYHHLRRDLYDVVSHAGCQIGARYTVPSAHVTIARFVVPVGEGRRAEIAELLSQRVARVIDKIEDINCVLRSDDWERFGSPARGEWVVGQEKGLELIKGRSWYGEGDRVVIGEGF